MENAMNCNGLMIYYATKAGLSYYKFDKVGIEDILEKHFSDDNGYDKEFRQCICERAFAYGIAGQIIDGKTFVNGVEDGKYANGHSETIFVNGYLTNLEIADISPSQKKFLIDMDLFKQLCDENEVKIDWVKDQEFNPFVFD